MMVSLKSIFLSVLREIKKDPLKVNPDVDQPGGFAGGLQQKAAPHVDSGWKYRGGFSGYSKGTGESDLPGDDEGQRDNEYEPLEGHN